MYILLGLDLASGTHGGAAFQVILVVLGGSLALGFSPLVAHSLLHVPVTEAADASGLLTTTLQLGQAIGVATFGSLFLTLAAHPVAHASGHALAVTMYWLAAVLALGVVVSIPLALTVRRARASTSVVAPDGRPASVRLARDSRGLWGAPGGRHRRKAGDTFVQYVA